MLARRLRTLLLPILAYFAVITSYMAEATEFQMEVECTHNPSAGNGCRWGEAPSCKVELIDQNGRVFAAESDLFYSWRVDLTDDIWEIHCDWGMQNINIYDGIRFIEDSSLTEGDGEVDEVYMVIENDRCECERSRTRNHYLSFYEYDHPKLLSRGSSRQWPLGAEEEFYYLGVGGFYELSECQTRGEVYCEKYSAHMIKQLHNLKFSLVE